LKKNRAGNIGFEVILFCDVIFCFAPDTPQKIKLLKHIHVAGSIGDEIKISLNYAN